MNKKHKIISSIVTGILIISIILCVTVVAQILTVGYVSVMGNSVFRVVTGSMEPTIPKGAILLSKEENIENIKVGDIICFRSKSSDMLGQVITHRVVEIFDTEDGKLCLETRGDANTVSDGYLVTSENLIGKVSWFTKDGNLMARILALLTDRVGFLSCIVFPILLITSLIMKDSIKSIRKELIKMSKVTEEVKPEPQDISSMMDPEEYEALVASLKKEILEELIQSVEAEKEQT